jgi:hypothetical protein
MTANNAYFLYDEENTNILRAANIRLHEVLKYWRPNRQIFYGTPQNHNWNITRAAVKLSPKYWEWRKQVERIENICQSK